MPGGFQTGPFQPAFQQVPTGAIIFQTPRIIVEARSRRDVEVRGRTRVEIGAPTRRTKVNS